MSLRYRAQQLPVIGPWVTRVGQVTEIMAMPCQPTPTMWVQGFFTAIPWLVWSLFKPDPIDATWARFGLPGATHRGARFRPKGLLQGLLMPGPINGRRTAVWELGELVQRIGWWFMIIDAGTELAVRWASATYQYAGCLNFPSLPCEGETNADYPITEGTSQYVQWGVVSDPGHRLTLSGLIFRQGDTKQYSIKPVVTHFDPEHWKPPIYRLQIRRKSDGFVFYDFGLQDQGENNPQTFAHFSSNNDTNLHEYQLGLWIEVYSGAANLKGTKVWGGGGYLTSLLADP